jgi:predicted Zn-dependent peptidase
MAGRVDAVTAAEVQEAARDFFDSRQVALSVVGNLDGVRFGREDLAC